MTYVWNFFDPTASATVYGRRPKFFRAEHSATAEGENWAYGPTLPLSEGPLGFFYHIELKSSNLLLIKGTTPRTYILIK